MSEAVAASPPAGTRPWRWVLAPATAGALVSLTAGLLARHEPRSKGYFRLFFSDPIHLKAGFATAAAVLACFQLFTAAWIFRKLPWPKPAWVNPTHRWSGRLAFACTLPVAYHCIFKLGFRDPGARVLAHSLLGCAVYGAFAAKVTILRLHRFPRPVLPLGGGLLFATLIGVWYTSALWLYRQSAAPASAASNPGAVVFKSAGCGFCHTLAAAGSHGTLGPNLDRLRPTAAAVRAQVTNGGGNMPAFAGRLTPAQIRAVAAYVADSARQ
jgi:mono/diheme cytochrome c family protein